MTPLRQRLIEDLQLKGMSERTQQVYVRAVRQCGRPMQCLEELPPQKQSPRTCRPIRPP